MKLTRLFHTVRYLKPRQITGQFLLRLRPLWENPEHFFMREAPAFPGCCWKPVESFLAPDIHQNSATKLLSGSYRFLNRSERIGWPPNWECDDLPKLWRYNLHYFEWLWLLDYKQAQNVTLDWIKQYDLRRGRTGWEPYTISLRLINWCAFFFGEHRVKTETDRDFAKSLWRSLFLQTEWLIRHLEVHIMGNHLFENGAALAFLGSCFHGGAADRWRRLGKKLLEKEISEQILPDGLHFERSPMYHLRLSYLLILLLQSGNIKLHEIAAEPLLRMLNALIMVCHPDAEIALFNDSAFGIYNKPLELCVAGVRLLGKEKLESENITGAWALQDAGYYGFRGDKGTYLICDAGRIGSDYVPGHAHADIFSFELSLRSYRVIVDSGVHDYDISEIRRYCRSTRAHNTVEINGQDQCEMWGAFRVARRGYPRDVRWLPSNDEFFLEGWHDGYHRLVGRPTHTRRIHWHACGRLKITDMVTSVRSVNVLSRFHLHPNCIVKEIEEDHILVEFPVGVFQVTFTNYDRVICEESFYCPEFGVKQSNAVLTFASHGTYIETTIQIELL